MTLDVETPPPPRLEPAVDPNQYDDTTISSGDDYRRGQLSDLLEAGAWEEAFERWAAETPMTEDEWRIVDELDLVSRFDFFWDDFAGRVGYHAPGIPQDWKERTVHPDITSWKEVSSINAGLTEFGQLVCDVLKDEYITWESEYEAPDDLPEF